MYFDVPSLRNCLNGHHTRDVSVILGLLNCPGRPKLSKLMRNVRDKIAETLRARFVHLPPPSVSLCYVSRALLPAGFGLAQAHQLLWKRVQSN